ncbi:hypothetical protein F4780DRAFT_420626 [Xylariomycetidae sp. FL0641]|nr:hypothetical protein F4780DRAFT_420626 [Xylariomycetidae sp. FL0641]
MLHLPRFLSLPPCRFGFGSRGLPTWSGIARPESFLGLRAWGTRSTASVIGDIFSSRMELTYPIQLRSTSRCRPVFSLVSATSLQCVLSYVLQYGGAQYAGKCGYATAVQRAEQSGCSVHMQRAAIHTAETSLGCLTVIPQKISPRGGASE